MHPVMTEALITERSRDMQLRAVATGMAREIRRSRRAARVRRPWQARRPRERTVLTDA
jgi:hypothetical protein